MRRLFFAAFIISQFLAIITAQAGSSDWIVDRASQPAFYTVNIGKSWHRVGAGITLPDRAWVNTGSGGKVLLRRGKDTILVGSNTMAAAFEKGNGKHTKVHQGFGTVEIDVQKRGYDHMSVQTPFMVAVVKGTKFSVTSNKKNSSLSVERGLVEVTNPASGEVASVGAGGESGRECRRCERPERIGPECLNERQRSGWQGR